MAIKADRANRAGLSGAWHRFWDVPIPQVGRCGVGLVNPGLPAPLAEECQAACPHAACEFFAKVPVGRVQPVLVEAH